MFHIRNTRSLGQSGGVSYMEHPGPFGEEGCFIYGTPLAFWRGHRVSPAKRPGLGRQTAAATPLPPSPHGPFRRSRAVFSRKPGLSRRISCRQKIAPIFMRQKIRGGWIPSGCGERLREPFSSLKAPYGCHGVRPLFPGSIGPCAAFPWLPTAITLLPPCALRGFPAGSPRAHAGFCPGIFPPKADEVSPWDSPGQNPGVPQGLPPAFQPPGHPGDPPRPGRGFSRPSPRALPGKRMGRAWGDGGSGGGDGR